MGTPREDLADKLREARTASGIGSQAALAKRLTVSRSLITKAETATHAVPSEPLIIAWAGITGVPAEPLIALARRARSGTPEWFMPYLFAEAEASMLRYWHPLLVPGVFQTESYARAVLGVEKHARERLDELVAARMERQAVIGQAHVTAIIDQQVLDRMIGSAVIMAEQCDYLGKLADHPDIALHVIPHGVNMGLWGGFDLATDGSTTTICLSALEDIPSTAPDLLGKAMLAFEQLLGAALPCAESLALIRTAEERWKAQI
jgi:transcriptional regulator with XRE-family HTH domain